jgi:cation transport protein ChaC
MMEQGDLWVFGYGSLMWDPGFEYVERRLARLDGHARRFCLRSVRYRGTPEAPGLVLGLDPTPGAACDGVAYRVEASMAEPVTAYLRERELVTYAYLERVVPVRLHDENRLVEALTFVVDHAHAQYAGHLSPAEQAEIIATRHGPKGSNLSYFENTLAHLAECGIAYPALEALAVLVRQGR